MYSLVLMAAVTAGPETPQFNGFFRDLFHGSCHGRDRDTSASASSGSCHGSCHGFLGIRDFFSGLGCRGSCHGSCHGSCNGSCQGSCNGSRPRTADPGYDRGYVSGCTGNGCYASAGGSCFGSSCYGSCMGSTPSFGYDMGMPPISVPSAPGGFATPRTVEYGSVVAPGCDCFSTAATLGVPSAGVPVLTADPTPMGYPTITPPGLPVPNRMPEVQLDRDNSTSRQKVPLTAPAPDATRGTVLVRVPADAKLFVEGRPLTVTNGERTFVTPPLPADRDAVYSFKVEYTRDGETLTQAKKVRVRAGGTAAVEFVDLVAADKPVVQSERVTAVPPAGETRKPIPFDVPTPAFNAKTTTKPTAADAPTVKAPFPADQAKITVKLPSGASLYVNGAKNDRTEAVRDFVTPTLVPGKIYEYVMKAEVVRNGLPEYQEQKIEFRGGDMLTVDFTTQANAGR